VLICAQGAGWGFEPTTTSGASASACGQARTWASLPTALNALLMAATVGVSGIGSTDPGGINGWRTRMPTPTTWMSRCSEISLPSFATVHPASLNIGISWRKKEKPSSAPPMVQPTLMVAWGNFLSAATNSFACSSVNLRGLMRSWSSNSLRSAVAALVSCFAISVFAFTASCSRPATRASAFAARSCCVAREDLAAVRSLSNWRSCCCWRLLITLPVIRTPALAANVRINRITAVQSNTIFSPSTVIDEGFGDPLNCLLLIPRGRPIRTTWEAT
jgi:hypothetical protein